MTDITTRLRRLYVKAGTNYAWHAADLIDNLRSKQARADQYHAAELADITAERDGWKSIAEQRAGQMKALVNDVHSCGPTCQKAGCVNRRLREKVAHLEQLITDATYTLSKARIWNGMDWTYNPLHPVIYTQMRERLSNEADAIYAARETK
jgi:hypothetical protein